MTRLHFDDKPTRREVIDATRRQARADGDRAQQEADARNLELIRTDATLRRLMTAYRQLDATGREEVVKRAEWLAGVSS